MFKKEIKKELQEQDVAEVHRVTVKRDTEKVPTNTLFLTLTHQKCPYIYIYMTDMFKRFIR